MTAWACSQRSAKVCRTHVDNAGATFTGAAYHGGVNLLPMRVIRLKQPILGIFRYAKALMERFTRDLDTDQSIVPSDPELNHRTSRIHERMKVHHHRSP